MFTYLSFLSFSIIFFKISSSRNGGIFPQFASVNSGKKIDKAWLLERTGKQPEAEIFPLNNRARE